MKCSALRLLVKQSGPLREMAIWQPKLGALYKVSSKNFSGHKSIRFPQGFAHNTIEQWSFS